jgi:NADPH-dependent curcumin reductase CurA
MDRSQSTVLQPSQDALAHRVNRRVVLASRPKGRPTAENFRVEADEVPAPQDNQFLMKTLYLSLDPYMRGRMSDAESYAEPMKVGSTMEGGSVGRVEDSRHPNFKAGDLVLAYGGWQEFAVSDGTSVTKLDPALQHLSLTLGVLGMPGFTAYMGLLDIGQPVIGETVVVGAASGAVGSVVGQIAKIKGCRAIGVAGGEEKCRFVVDKLGFDACLNRRDPSFAEKIAAACPEGIDVYFESVGGAVFDAVLPLLNTKARIPVCGLISTYNATDLPDGKDRLGMLMRTILIKRLKMQGFIIFDDYGPRFGEFSQQMNRWVQDGRVKFREDVVDGLENAPSAFIGMLEGENFGKLVVRVSQE